MGGWVGVALPSLLRASSSALAALCGQLNLPTQMVVEEGVRCRKQSVELSERATGSTLQGRRRREWEEAKGRGEGEGMPG